jgi:hypothetical protein
MALVTLYYLCVIFRKGIKPHLFSWLIWGILATTAGAAQLSAHGGIGGWMTLAKAAMIFLVAGIAFRRGEKNITRSDWTTLIVSLTAVPVWIATKDPLWAVVLATLIDMAGYIPTYRKSFLRPNEESAGLFLLSSLSNFLIILGLESYSPTTALYPSAALLANMLLVGMIFLRRRYTRPCC